MSFLIPSFQIPDNSPEANIIAAIMDRDNVSPQDAVKQMLRNVAHEKAKITEVTAQKEPSPGELLIGLFADDPDLILNIAKEARESRDREIVKDISA